MYKVLILDKARKKLLKMNEKEYQIAREKIKELSKFPLVRNLKKLKGFKDYFRIRVKKYRILFIVNYNKKEIYVVNVEKRSTVYRHLK